MVVTKHSGLNESDASSESGMEDVLSVNSSEPDSTCLPKGVYSLVLRDGAKHWCPGGLRDGDEIFVKV